MISFNISQIYFTLHLAEDIPLTVHAKVPSLFLGYFLPLPLGLSIGALLSCYVSIVASLVVC